MALVYLGLFFRESDQAGNGKKRPFPDPFKDGGIARRVRPVKSEMNRPEGRLLTDLIENMWVDLWVDYGNASLEPPIFTLF